MNTNVIIGVVVALVVVGGGAWYLTTHEGGAAQAPAAQTEDSTQSASGAGTFASLMARSGDWQCTIKTIAGTPTTGVSYVSGGKVRADMESDTNAGKIASHMIAADGYVYTWTSAYPQGFKMALTAAQSGSASGSNGSVGANTSVQYSCEPWSADASLFVPPADISFMEFSGAPQPQ